MLRVRYNNLLYFYIYFYLFVFFLLSVFLFISVVYLSVVIVVTIFGKCNFDRILFVGGRIAGRECVALVSRKK